MAKSRNKVIKGRYNNSKIFSNGSFLTISQYRADPLRRPYIESYELLTEESVKSGTSAILRGAVGMALLGGVGILAGLTAKSNDIYTVAIKWKDGDISIIEIDSKLYKCLITSMI